MMDARSPRREFGAREYLAVTFEPSDRLAVLLRNRHRGETVQRITTAGRIVEPTFQEWLQLKNREGFDVYVGMNPLKPAARTRTKEDILSIRHLYVDLDHQAAVSLASIQQSNLLPQPNYVLSTSPDKFQVIWRVEEVPQEQAEALLRAMARRFGGDPAATDSTRVLRIPGFRNRKYDEEFVVKAEQQSEHVYHFLDFKLRIDDVDSPLRRSPRRTVSTEPRPLTQSEHDWAFAKRAIARGTDPEEVVRRIAQYRNGEKHDAADYARRTVLKAQAELLGRHSVETPAETEKTESKAIGFDP
jgi:RepB DNA-primase from phage plasmid